MKQTSSTRTSSAKNAGLKAKTPAAAHPAAAQADEIIRKYERKLIDHREFIAVHGVDPAEITDWRWLG